MDQTARDRTIAPPPLAPNTPGTDIGDLRFQALLGGGAWSRLPQPVRRRFSKRLSGGATSVYVGQIVEVEASAAGRLLANLARLIGGPLPLVWDAPGPSVVTVTEDGATGGQIWSRLYARRRGFPQVVHSAKRFSGPTGLEEYIGCGLSMTLRAGEEDGALVFRSAGYALRIGSVRLRLPWWADPGDLEVRHDELGGGRFAFSLSLIHPRLGLLLRQRGVFREEIA